MSALATGLAVVCVIISALLLLLKSRRSAFASTKVSKSHTHYQENDFIKAVKSGFKDECNRIAKIDLNAEIERLGFDPSRAPSLERFQPVVQQTHCFFAKRAKLWGSQPWNIELSIEENIQKDLKAVELFARAGKGYHLDGFLIEVPNPKVKEDWMPQTVPSVSTQPISESCEHINVDSVEGFAEVVRRVLTAICDADSKKFRRGCMHVTESQFSRKGWFFEFANESFFITTFAPFYSVTGHARFSFGTTSGWILLQPEFSFVLNGIGDDTTVTNWEKPVTVRDKIRVDFKRNNREYEILDSIYYSPAIDVIKPLNRGDPIIEWWKPKEQQ